LPHFISHSLTQNKREQENKATTAAAFPISLLSLFVLCSLHIYENENENKNRRIKRKSEQQQNGEMKKMDL